MQDQQVVCPATLWQTQGHLTITFQFYTYQRIFTSNKQGKLQIYITQNFSNQKHESNYTPVHLITVQ
jgi:hypothetical protein